MGLVGKLWVSFKRTHQRTHGFWFEKASWFLSQIWSKCAHHMPEPLIESSFKKYPVICSTHTQPHTHWVLWEFMVKLNQIESFFWICLNEPARYILGKSLGIFWKNSQWVAQAYGGHILIKFVKETMRLFQIRTHGFFDGVRTDLANRPTEPMLVSLRARYTKLWGNRGFLQSGLRQTTPVCVGVTCGSGISVVRVGRI